MSKIFQHIYHHAYLVFLDGLRRHALLGLVFLAVACQICSLFFFSFISHDVGRATSDFVLSIGWLAGILLLFFHAVNTVSWGEERIIIHSILARPISRFEYVLGLFFGLAGLLFLLNVVLGSLGCGVLLYVRGQVALKYFEFYSPGYYILSWVSLYVVQLMILAMILLFSGLVRGGFAVLLVTVSYYFICSGLPVVRETVLLNEATTGSYLPVFLQWLTAVFPDFERFNYKTFIATQKALPALNDLMVNFGLAIGYVCIALWVAGLVYSKRDLN